MCQSKDCQLIIDGVVGGLEGLGSQLEAAVDNHSQTCSQVFSLPSYITDPKSFFLHYSNCNLLLGRTVVSLLAATLANSSMLLGANDMRGMTRRVEMHVV